LLGGDARRGRQGGEFAGRADAWCSEGAFGGGVECGVGARNKQRVVGEGGECTGAGAERGGGYRQQREREEALDEDPTVATVAMRGSSVSGAWGAM
jgi:hypothetical protein